MSEREREAPKVDIEELRAKAIASMAAAAASSHKKPPKSLDNKEEGEVSSSDEAEIPAGSPATFIPKTTGVAPSKVELNVVGVRKTNQIPKTGKIASRADPASSADPWLRTSVKPNYSKPAMRKPSSSVLGNPYTSSWHASSVADNNLVIRFSDDDSGSDSEKQRRKGFSLKKETISRAGRPSTRAEPAYISKNVKNQLKRKSRIDSTTSRTYVLSLAKTHGGIPRASGPSLAEQTSHVRSPDFLSKGSTSQLNETSAGMNSKNSTLEDLRQQIARKENQLKHKSVQQAKEIKRISGDDHGCLNLNSDAAKKSGHAYGNTKRLLSDESEKKRLKVDHYPMKSDLHDDRQMRELPTRSECKSRMTLFENIRQEDENWMTSSQFPPQNAVATVDLVAETQLAKVQKQVPVASGNLVQRVNSCESSRPNHETTSSEVQSYMFRDALVGCGSNIPNNDYQDGEMNRSFHLVGGLNEFPASVQPASKEDMQQLKSCPPKKSNTDGPNVHATLGAVSSSLIGKEAQHTIVKSSEGNEIVPSEREAPLKNNMVDKGSVPIPESKFHTPDVSLSNTTLLDNLGQTTVMVHNHKSLQKLLEMEELHDKELEEAQEHRRRCEVAEKNALRAYRESQRALFEANAKCSYLYQKRELFSSQFRTLMMVDPSSLWPALQNNNRETDEDHLSALGHPSHAELENVNLGSNIQPTDGVIVHTTCQQMGEGNLFSEPCAEPKSSTLDLLHHNENDVNGVCTPSCHTNISTDEDEDASLFGHKTALSLVTREEAACSKDLNKNPEVHPVDNGNNYALIEANLRSQLCERYGKDNVSKHKNLRDGKECGSNDVTESLVVNKNSSKTMSSKRYAQSGEEQISKAGGADTLERSTYSPIRVHGTTQVHHDECSKDLTNRIDSNNESSFSFTKACKPTESSVSSPSPVLKLAFTYMNVTPFTSFREIQTKSQKTCVHETLNEDESARVHSELLLGVLRTRLRGNIGEVGCYSCDFSLDPFWPVCMFELRGRCNDEECIWQHRRDYIEKNTNRRDCSESVDFRSHQQPVVLAPPTYVVGLDIMKADFYTAESVLAQNIGQCWQKGFSLSAYLPYTTQKTCFPNIPSFDSDSNRLMGQGSGSRQSMYFQSQDVSLKQTTCDLNDPEQYLDMAVLFDGDGGMQKAQITLSRALEAHPTFVPLWIIYLHIHYMNETTIGKDDMFAYAIHYNEGSYELWLMYINSRVHLNDRLVCYDSALSALSQHASSPNRDRVHDSTCILDLFLQLLDCLCMSGDKEKAIQRIFALLPTTTGASNSTSILLSDILACLTTSDKCIFWICCVYVVMYGKLPDAVVQQFEFEKKLEIVVEWPPVQLTAVEKQKALELMKMGVDSVALNGGMCAREVCFLSISHVQSVAALEGTECSKSLLEHYLKTYPTCLELVLTSARMQRNHLGDFSFVGFEKALSDWPKEVPGVQCIWNQYGQCALENGGSDFAKQLMVRWLESVSKVDCPQSGKLDVMEDDGLYNSPESVSPNDVCYTFSNPKDELFGLLNLSLHRLLLNDRTEARHTIDKALKLASQEDFEHCVREHAVFISTDLSCQTADALSTRVLSLLNVYLNDARVRSVSDPLSRKFFQDIKKPRIRQLISNLLGPVPCSYSLVNSVLESWYGPSLLPENCDDLKELVDLVETLTEMYPSNYPLALSACKLIARKFTSNGISSATTLFWASSLLISSIHQAFPVPPERTLVDVVEILNGLVEVHGISERFHQYALSRYPFSVRLWESYYKVSKKGDESSVVQRAKRRGIQLD